MLIAGEANAVGVASDSGAGQADDLSGLPVYALSEGLISTPLQFSQPWVVPLNEAVTRCPNSFNQGGVNSLAASFAKKYIGDGFLRTGRALLFVNAAKTGSALGFNDGTTISGTALPGLTVQNTWVPSTRCDSSFSQVQNVTSFSSTNVPLNLFTYANYRIDLALSINPATGVNHASDFSRYTTTGPAPAYANIINNRVVSVLWHQGETDLSHGTTAAQYATCLADLVSGWKYRYGRGQYASNIDRKVQNSYRDYVVFILGGYASNTGASQLLSDYTKFYKFNFGQGRYEQAYAGQIGPPPEDFTAGPSFIDTVDGTNRLGFADSLYTYSGSSAPLGEIGATFSQQEIQSMGVRYGEAYKAIMGDSHQLAPVACKPLMGWRSWNFYKGDITQDLMQANMDKLANRSVPWVTSRYPGMSLADLGYKDIGLDDGYMVCIRDAPSAQKQNNPYKAHTRAGNLIMDTNKFPDMKAMTARAHSLGLTAGWYMGQCICQFDTTPGDNIGGFASTEDFVVQDTKLLVEFGFDNLKLDGCNKVEIDQMEWWYHLLPIGTQFENCFGGSNPSSPNITGYTQILDKQAFSDVVDSNDNVYWPQTYYRSSGDIINTFWDRTAHTGVIPNMLAASTAALLNASTPFAWAYADMLYLTGPSYGGSDMTLGVARVQFGSDCILSCPLILSSDILNDNRIAPYAPIFVNQEAIQVNQEYYGFSGSLFTPSQSSLNNNNAFFLYKPMSWDNSSVAVMAINLDSAGSTSGSLFFADVPYLRSTQNVAVYDIWAETLVGTFSGVYQFTNLGFEDCVFLKLSLI